MQTLGNDLMRAQTAFARLLELDIPYAGWHVRWQARFFEKGILQRSGAEAPDTVGKIQ
jgi:hypothetical protein